MEVNGEIVFEPLPSDDPKKRRPDISKAKKVLGWEPKVLLEDGLRETVGYFKGLESVENAQVEMATEERR
jgi:nucleoside-diphosphate-sugar epimerase